MKVTVMQKRDVELIRYYLLRGIKGEIGEARTVIAERECIDLPTSTEIAKFIIETGCDFATVERGNYRISDFPGFLASKEAL